MLIKKIVKSNQSKLLTFELSIRQSEPDIWCEPFDLKRLEEQLALQSDHNIIYGLFVDDQMVGRCDIILMKSMMNFTTTAYIDWIYIDKRYRHKGYGKLLLNSVIEKMEACEEILLFTASNEAAQHYYKSFETLRIEKKEVATLS